jgi:hypothetical protein
MHMRHADPSFIAARELRVSRNLVALAAAGTCCTCMATPYPGEPF